MLVSKQKSCTVITHAFKPSFITLKNSFTALCSGTLFLWTSSFNQTSIIALFVTPTQLNITPFFLFHPALMTCIPNKSEVFSHKLYMFSLSIIRSLIYFTTYFGDSLLDPYRVCAHNIQLVTIQHLLPHFLFKKSPWASQLFQVAPFSR